MRQTRFHFQWPDSGTAMTVVLEPGRHFPRVQFVDEPTESDLDDAEQIATAMRGMGPGEAEQYLRSIRVDYTLTER